MGSIVSSIRDVCQALLNASSDGDGKAPFSMRPFTKADVGEVLVCNVYNAICDITERMP